MASAACDTSSWLRSDVLCAVAEAPTRNSREKVGQCRKVVAKILAIAIRVDRLHHRVEAALPRRRAAGNLLKDIGVPHLVLSVGRERVPFVAGDELLEHLGRLAVMMRVEFRGRGVELLFGRLAADHKINRRRRQPQRQRKTEHSEDNRRPQGFLLAGPHALRGQSLGEPRRAGEAWTGSKAAGGRCFRPARLRQAGRRSRRSSASARREESSVPNFCPLRATDARPCPTRASRESRDGPNPGSSAGHPPSSDATALRPRQSPDSRGTTWDRESPEATGPATNRRQRPAARAPVRPSSARRDRPGRSASRRRP